MMELHTSGEDYLEAVLILSRTCPEVRSVDIAEHLGVSRPSVSRAVSLLRRGGFLEAEGAYLRLTEAGREIADGIYEKHCYFKARLMEVGVDEATADKEACLIEHAVSDESFDKLRASTPQSISIIPIINDNGAAVRRIFV